MLTEDVDESLVLLGKILGWDPIDLTYASLLKTGANGSVRWDGKAVQKAPKPEDLDEDVRECPPVAAQDHARSIS